MEQVIFTVDKICGYIKKIFDSEVLLHDIQVSGEISNYTETNNNAYFTLKGKDSQISCVFFAVDLRKFIPKNGDNCILKGSVTYYKKGGKLSFYVTDLNPIGQGDSYLKFLQLKDKLEKQGIFDEANKIPLPFFVNKIGVITSRSGAVIHDIIDTATKKFPAIDIVLYSVRVQGTESAKEIADGIAVMEQTDVDVIIVARGGGSNEDLSAYNTEVVARAVYNCKKPVVSAVGHETDYTLCDLAADKRAATPTQAADVTLQSAEFLKERLSNIMQNINNNVTIVFNNYYTNLKSILKNMYFNIGNTIDNYSLDSKYKTNEIGLKTEKIYKQKESNLVNLITKIDALNPLNILKRGFGFITDNKDIAVKSIKHIKTGDQVNIILSDGSAQAEIKNKKERIL